MGERKRQNEKNRKKRDRENHSTNNKPADLRLVFFAPCVELCV